MLLKRPLDASIKQKLPITPEIFRNMFTFIDFFSPLDVNVLGCMPCGFLLLFPEIQSLS